MASNDLKLSDFTGEPDVEIQRKHPYAKCEECPLASVGKFMPSVIPEGGAEIAFVGEAPSLADVKTGVPFSGQSGRLLNRVMDHHRINKEQVLMTNACLCRPPDNQPPTEAAIRACRPRLNHELERAGVETAVALGNPAAISLLGQTGVTKLRVGPGRDAKFIEGVKVIPTLSPAAALRQGDMFPHIVQDIGKVVHRLADWNPPTWVVVDDDDSALRALDELTNRAGGPESRLVVDIEVDIEKDTAFGHPNQYGMLCVGVGYAKGRVVVFGERAMESERVRAGLADVLRRSRISGQNVKFDLSGVFPLLGPLEADFDTMFASYCFDERPGIHGLKYQAVEYLGTPQYDDEIKKYVGPGIGYGAIPRDILYKYNAYDVACTWDLQDWYEERFEDAPDLRRVHDFMVKAANQLMYVELNGITVDRVYLSQLETQFLAELDRLEGLMDALLEGSDFEEKDYDKTGGINPRSPQQVKQYLADRGVVVEGTSVDIMEKIAERLIQINQEKHEVFQFIDLLLKHRKQAKLYGTYVKGIRKRLYGGRVFPSFLLHGTTTGRPACRNPNLLNIPRDSSIRRLFVPAKPGWVIMQTDYSQAELRVLSYLAGDQYFRDIFNDGTRDPFDELTHILYPETAGYDKKTVPGGPAQWKEYRIRVKAFVYGLAYGRTEFSIAAEFAIPEKEAVRMKDNFFAVIPEIVQLQRDIKASVRAGEDLITPWGRHRRFPLITKENEKSVMNEALAFLPQSTASDMCMEAFTHVRKELKGIGFVRNIIYDAILTEVREEDVKEVGELVEKHMLAAAHSIVGDSIKFAVDTDYGPSWGDA